MINDDWIRLRALRTLGEQTSLSKETIAALIRPHKLEDDRVKTTIAISSLSNLSDMTVKAIQSTMDSGSTSEGLDLLKFSYGIFFVCGFGEQFHLYIEDGSLVICLPDDSCIKIKVPRALPSLNLNQ